MKPRRRGRRAGPAAPPPAAVEGTIAGIGSQNGDGIMESAGRRWFVPLAAPGDWVRVQPPAANAAAACATLLAVLRPGERRAVPPCRHFGQCGGCRLQHLDDATYVAWKRDRVAGALAAVGIRDIVPQPLIRTPPATRRRARFAAARLGPGPAGTVIGFNVHAGHRIIDLQMCSVLRPEITALLPGLRSLLAGILAPRQRTAVMVSLLDDGLDVVLEWPRAPDLPLREVLARFADAADLARLSWQSADRAAEPVVQRRAVTARFAGIPVSVPPGAFLQASAAGEAALIDAVREAVADAAPVADLFCGIGTFALPLARTGARVQAFDGDAAATAALRSAAGALPQLSVECRDLDAQPLTVRELNRFAAVTFDPPRDGAARQAAALAHSTVPRVIAVSCNPDSFARDARLLCEGGYRLDWVRPIDQFLWSPHVEVVALFRR